MTFLLAGGVVVAFAMTLVGLSLPDRAQEAARSAARCSRVLRDPALDDEAKERILQRQALRLFRLLGILAGGSLLALGLPLAGVWLLEQAGVSTLDGVLAVLQRLDFLLATTAVGTIGYLVSRRLGSR